MPLTDVVRYLNARDRESRPFPTLSDPFYPHGRGAIARYARINLSTVYAPIRSASSGRLYGHSASLVARGELNDQLLHPEAVFAIPSTNGEFIHLDRLVRTLHALNYITHPNAQHLFVKVNLRHIESVSRNHGLVFENALKVCGLHPESITLEVQVNGEPNTALRSALDSYRTFGYQLALTHTNGDWSDAHWLRQVKPDFVRLDKRTLRAPRKLTDLVRRLHEAGIKTVAEVQEHSLQVERARGAGVDLLQYPQEAENYQDRVTRGRDHGRIVHPREVVGT